jgi:hypothetical protein
MKGSREQESRPQDDPVVLPTQGVSFPALAMVLAVFAILCITILIGVVPAAYLGYLVLLGAIASLAATVIGVIGAWRARREPEKYQGFWLAVGAVFVAHVWFLGGFKTGILQKLAVGELFHDYHAEAIAHCQSGDVIGSCDQAGIYALNELHDRELGLSLLEKGCNRQDPYSCSILVDELRSSSDAASQRRRQVAIANGTRWCQDDMLADTLPCVSFKAPHDSAHPAAPKRGERPATTVSLPR